MRSFLHGIRVGITVGVLLTFCAGCTALPNEPPRTVDMTVKVSGCRTKQVDETLHAACAWAHQLQELKEALEKRTGRKVQLLGRSVINCQPHMWAGVCAHRDAELTLGLPL